MRAWGGSPFLVALGMLLALGVQAEPTPLRIAILTPVASGDTARGDPTAGQRWALALAERLRTWDALEVVGPSDAEVPAEVAGQATALRAWAQAAGLGAVILCESFSQDAGAVICDLRSGHSGASLSRYPIEAASGEGAPSAASIERVFAAIRRDLQAEKNALVLPAVSAAHASAEAEVDQVPPIFDRDLPIRIESDELDVITEGKTRRLVFIRNVFVKQGEIELYTSHLEAFYPEGSSQPERLEASGGVRVIEKDREVRCKNATYHRKKGIVLCKGDAVLVQGCDEVRGSEIEFDLVNERVRVVGAATVVLQPESKTKKGCRETPG